MEDFHVILPSNVKNLAGTGNKTGHYTTYLPKPLVLDKDAWKVAVVDVSYVVSWFNVTMETCAVITRTTRNGQNKEVRRHIPLRHYADASSLAQAINTMLVRDSGFASSMVWLGDAKNKARILIQPDESLTLHELTAAMLGYRQNSFEHSGSTRIATRFDSTNPPNVHLPIQNIYIYSNLVEEIPVGDTYAPLLQVVPVRNGVYGSVQHHEFLNPLYTSLATNDLSVIEIKLCDDRGNVIEFDVGNVILKLHFVKK